MSDWSFYDHLDAYVYVADVDTHKLVYLNQKWRNALGLSSDDRIEGKICHELLESSCAPCAICDPDHLRPGFFRKKLYMSPLLHELLNINTTIIHEDGRRFCFEIAFNATSPISEDTDSNDQRREKILQQGIQLAMHESNPDRVLDLLLEYLGKALNGKRTYIFEKDSNGYDSNTYEWVTTGAAPEKDLLQHLPPSICSGWYRKFQEGQMIVIRSLEEIKASDPTIYSILEKKNVQTLCAVPLFDDDTCIGFYGVDNPPANKINLVSALLEITGNFMVAALRRRNLQRQLIHMSLHDQLTGLGNRYSMYQYIEKLNPGIPLGLFFCDLTGLKKVNDTKGHQEGDLLIKSAAECMQAVFSHNAIFRIGGDEMVAFLPDISEHELINAEVSLRQVLTKRAVNMAVGTAWTNDGKNHVLELLKDSESRMYKDKKTYYQNSDADRRKP